MIDEYSVFDPVDWDRNTDAPARPIPEATLRSTADTSYLIRLFLVVMALGMIACGLCILASSGGGNQ